MSEITFEVICQYIVEKFPQLNYNNLFVGKVKELLKIA